MMYLSQAHTKGFDKFYEDILKELTKLKYIKHLLDMS